MSGIRMASVLGIRPLARNGRLLLTPRWAATGQGKDADFFELLEVPRSYDIQESNLKSNYRRLMVKYHPDRHVLKLSAEQEGLERQAARITDAYQVLKEPHTRATYLLELYNDPMDETSSGDLVGPAFLMEVMELRETIDSTAPDALRNLWEDTNKNIEAVVDDIAVAFRSKDLTQAKKLAAQLQYWNRIEETIRDKMDDE